MAETLQADQARTREPRRLTERLARLTGRLAGLTATAVLSLGLIGVVAGPAQAGPAEDLVASINAERAAAGVGPVSLNAAMSSVAAAWSQYQADTATMAHNPSFSGQIPGGWSSAAENVAWNQPASVGGLHVAWMKSAPHRANILNGAFTDVGIAVVIQDGKAWGTEVFAAYGAPAPAPVAAPAAAAVSVPAPAPAPAPEPAPAPAPAPEPAPVPVSAPVEPAPAAELPPAPTATATPTAEPTRAAERAIDTAAASSADPGAGGSVADAHSGALGAVVHPASTVPAGLGIGLGLGAAILAAAALAWTWRRSHGVPVTVVDQETGPTT